LILAYEKLKFGGIAGKGGGIAAEMARFLHFADKAFCFQRKFTALSYAPPPPWRVAHLSKAQFYSQRRKAWVPHPFALFAKGWAGLSVSTTVRP